MIFIVGNSRSGTTLQGRILGLHDKIHTLGELHFFEQLVEAVDLVRGTDWSHERSVHVVEQLLTRARDGFFAVFTPGKYRALAEEVLALSTSYSPTDIYAAFMIYEAQQAGKSVPCEQTPRYLFFAKEILRNYPEARIINMIRDPRDVMISQRSKWKRRFLGGRSIPMREAIRSWSNYHPWLVSRLWASSIDYASAIGSERFMSVRFEDLLADPEKEVRAICNFVGVEFESQMLDAPQVGSSSGQDLPHKRGVNYQRAGGWRTSGIPSASRLVCEWVCYDRMKRLGYDDFLNQGQFSPSVMLSMLTLPGKLLLAIALNVRRFPRLFSSVRRRLLSQQGAA